MGLDSFNQLTAVHVKCMYHLCILTDSLRCQFTDGIITELELSVIFPVTRLIAEVFHCG